MGWKEVLKEDKKANQNNNIETKSDKDVVEGSKKAELKTNESDANGNITKAESEKNRELVENSNIEKVEDVEENQNLDILNKLKKGQELIAVNYETKEAETSPPSRYNSGSIILAMENAGKLIEDEELREQIKGAGIGTSATRAEIK